MRNIIKSIRRRVIFGLSYVSFISRRDKIDTQLIGSKYGNWYLPCDLIDRLSDQRGICLSGGVGEDISFEYELSSLSRLQFKLYDFTPRSIKYFAGIREGWSDGITCDGGKIYCPDFKISNFELVPYGLGVRDDILLFRPPSNPNHVSWSHATVEEGCSPFKVVALKNQVSKYAREHLFMCKLDIEGSEADILNDEDTLIFLSSFNIILLELDYLKSSNLISSIRYLMRVHKLFNTHILFYADDYNVGFMRKSG